MKEKALGRSLGKGGVVLHPTVKQEMEGALVTFEVSGRKSSSAKQGVLWGKQSDNQWSAKATADELKPGCPIQAVNHQKRRAW